MSAAEFSVHSLVDFYDLMYSTRDLRRQALEELLAGKDPDREIQTRLQKALAALESLAQDDAGRRQISQEDQMISLDLSYECAELRKDIQYLQYGFAGLMSWLNEQFPGFGANLEEVSDFLEQKTPRLLFTDRDGTVNNYCARYLSSVQSLYNAHSLVSYSALPEVSVLLTSAPLGEKDGLLRVNIMPDGHFVFAASKGREYLDQHGRRQVFPVPDEQQQALAKLNDSLEALLQEKANRVFAMIGSGFQCKFGQTTIARQDMGGSIPEEKSQQFLQTIQELVREHDPEEKTFRIEDTGMDIEIILTLPEGSSGDAEARDFDKGDGLRFLDESLGLGIPQGEVLVCGDTASDLAMLKAVSAVSDKLRSLFIGCNAALKAQVQDCGGQSAFANTPDVLVLAMAKVAGLF